MSDRDLPRTETARLESSGTDRATLMARLRSTPQWDLAVIGGGATGLGVAVDAALRGLRVVLLESHDFAHGTSSRATKLLHGGVRYLAQGNLSLVREALRERSTVIRNAPALARPLAFVVPAYRWWESWFLGLGLLAYEKLAGARSLGPTQRLSRRALLERAPQVRAEGLRGGVRYWDAQFDDAQLAIALARSAGRLGALVINHCRVDDVLLEGDRITGLRCTDTETGAPCEVHAHCVVNAGGVWVDTIRSLGTATPPPPRVRVSQGSHVVVDREFWPGEEALLVPRTADGRVLFAVPWLGKVILGTTDTARDDAPSQPRPQPEEIDFILAEAGRYLARPPTRADVRSAWAGLRPLVRPDDGAARGTGRISREHAIWTEPSGLVCVTGGKWTTYRVMAQEVVDHAIAQGLVAPGRRGPTLRTEQGTEHLPLHRDDTLWLDALPGADHCLAPGVTEQRVRFAVRHEFARTVEDVLARRARLLFLDARAACAAAPAVAAILRDEGVADPQLGAFLETAAGYLP